MTAPLTEPLTDRWIEEQLELCANATPEPWVIGIRDSWSWPVFAIRDMESGDLAEAQRDAELIAAAREGYPLALKELRRLRTLLVERDAEAECVSCGAMLLIRNLTDGICFECKEATDGS